MTDKLDNTKGTLANYFDRFIVAKHGNFTKKKNEKIEIF